ADRWRGRVEYEALPRLDRPRRGYHHSANNRAAPDDHAAPLYGAWAGGNRATLIRELIEATERISPERSRALQHDLYLPRAARLLEGEPIAWLSTTTLDAEVVAAAGAALVSLRERFGDDPAGWSWRRVHTIELAHPLAAGRPAFAEVANVGPAAVPGSSDT